MALRSMHALAALITPGFHESKWTNQEIGWALGRGILLLPIRMGADPLGFIGSVQAIPGNASGTGKMASEIMDILLGHGTTRTRTRLGLMTAFSGAETWASAKALCAHIINLTDFTEKEKEILWTACASNNQVSNAFGVTGKIYALIGKPPPPKVIEADSDIPF